MKKGFNYLAAAVLVVLINIPFYSSVWFSLIPAKPTQAMTLPIVLLVVVLVPVATYYFLKYFSDGVNLKNGLILGTFVSAGCLVLDYLFFGLVMGMGIGFLKSWLFPAVYILIFAESPLSAYIIQKS